MTWICPRARQRPGPTGRPAVAASCGPGMAGVGLLGTGTRGLRRGRGPGRRGNPGLPRLQTASAPQWRRYGFARPALCDYRPPLRTRLPRPRQSAVRSLRPPRPARPRARSGHADRAGRAGGGREAATDGAAAARLARRRAAPADRWCGGPLYNDARWRRWRSRPSTWPCSGTETWVTPGREGRGRRRGGPYRNRRVADRESGRCRPATFPSP